jgi:hypothetical protein
MPHVNLTKLQILLEEGLSEYLKQQQKKPQTKIFYANKLSYLTT